MWVRSLLQRQRKMEEGGKQWREIERKKVRERLVAMQEMTTSNVILSKTLIIFWKHNQESHSQRGTLPSTVLAAGERMEDQRESRTE